MNKLIALDFANLETFQDSKSALKAIVSPNIWGGDTSLARVKHFVGQSVYKADTTTSNQNTSLFFSGRAALKILLKELQLTPNSTVALQAFTCAAVALPIISLGLKPLYIDINQNDFSMDVEDLKRKYDQNVKVLILQHSFGITPTKRDEIIEFCKQNEIFLVEDLAHGYIPNTLKPPQGTLNYGALLSFGRSKLLSSVFGAAVLTPNKALSARVENVFSSLPKAPKSLILRCLLYKILAPTIKCTYSLLVGKALHRLCILLNAFPREISSVEESGKYDSNYEYKYPEIFAYTLQPQINRLTSLLSSIKVAVGEYEQNLRSLAPYPTTPLNRFPYILPDSVDRADILRHFKMQNILLGTWYDQPVGPGKLDLRAVQYTSGSCPNAENISRCMLNLPTNVSGEEARLIAQELQDLLSKYEH